MKKLIFILSIIILNSNMSFGQSGPKKGCNEVACPDLTIDKTIVDPTGGTVFQGGTITYQICVTNNEDAQTCPVDFYLRDILDATYLDYDSAQVTNVTGTLGVGVGDIGNDPTLLYYVTTLPSMGFVCITFTVDVLVTAPLGTLTNCASIDQVFECIDNSCVSIAVVNPVSEWPRTYGGTKIFKRYAIDTTTDDLGNVYTIGNLNANDTSNEDPVFLAIQSGFIMKHDYSGNLTWIEYINSHPKFSRIKYANNKLVVLTAAGNNTLIASYNTNGQFLSDYDLGGGDNRQLEIDKSSGDIYVSKRYKKDFTPNPADFSISATSKDHTIAIFKFTNSFLGISYVDHQLIYDDPAQFDNGAVHIWLNDLTYAEDIDKLYVTGFRNFGDVIFPNGQVLSDGRNYFGIRFDSSEFDLTMDSAIYEQSEYLGSLEFNNTLGKLYMQHEEQLYSHGTDIISSISLIDDLSLNSAVESEELIINQANGNIYSIGYNGTILGTVSKLTDSGIVWEKTVADMKPWDITVGLDDHLYICGQYFNDTAFDPSDLSQYVFGYGSNWDTFIARIKDNGLSGVFKKPQAQNTTLAEVEMRYAIVPNPSNGRFQIEAVTRNSTDLVTVQITDFYGTQVYNASSFDINQTIQLGSNLREGMYLVRITSQQGEVEIHKLLVGGK